MAELSGLGLSVDLPDGWDGRIYTRDEAGGTRASLHGATFPLPGTRGDYGSGAVEMMGPEDVLVVLLEFDPSSTGQPLFAAQGFPTLYPTNFTQRNLQRPIAGQAGRSGSSPRPAAPSASMSCWASSPTATAWRPSPPTSWPASASSEPRCSSQGHRMPVDNHMT